MTEPSGVDFGEAWLDRVVRDLKGRQIPFIGVAALKKNKVASGRPRDVADVVWLNRTYPTKP